MVATLSLDSPETTHMYVCGGYNGNTRLDTLQEYDIRADTWSYKASHGGPLWGCTLAGHSPTRTLWSVGGYDGTDILAQTLIYHYDRDSWTASVPTPYAVNSGTGVFIQDTFIRAGGQDDTYEYTDGVEALDIDGTAWRTLAPLSVERYRPGGVAHKNLFYVCGGVSSPWSCEVYHPDRDEWIQLPDMHHPRAGPGVSVSNGRLVAIGGYDCGAVCTAEGFDPREGKWSIITGWKEKLDGPGLVQEIRWRTYTDCNEDDGCISF